MSVTEGKATQDLRRTQIAKSMEDMFLPDYRADNMPSAEKRTAYALEHFAFRMGRIDQHLEKLVDAIAALAKP